MKSILVFCVIAIGFTNGVKLPKGLDVCTYSNNTCMLVAINNALPILYTGYSKLNFPPIDPLEVTRIDIDQGGSGPVSVKMSFLDSKIHGVKNTVVNSISGATKTPEGFEMKFNANLKELKLVGTYEINGQILILPLTGKGPYNLTLENVVFNTVMTGEDKPLVKKGKEYLKLKNFDFSFTTTRMRSHFEGLHNGDKILGDSTNLFLNENWKDILGELQPNIEKALGEIFKQITNRMFEKIPYNEVFLS